MLLFVSKVFQTDELLDGSEATGCRCAGIIESTSGEAPSCQDRRIRKNGGCGAHNDQQTGFIQKQAAGQYDVVLRAVPGMLDRRMVCR